MNNILVVLLLMAVIVTFPLGTIWSLNTLFQLEIAYTVDTWLATVFLQMVTFGGANVVSRQSK